MIKVGKWIAKYKVLVLIIGFLLLIPSFIGMQMTRVNYDLLSYLPERLDTVKGQNIMVDKYGMGAFSMVVVENMDLKDVQKLEDKFKEVPHVKDALSYNDVAGETVPVSMVPKKYRKAFIKGDAKMIIVLFDDTTSSDQTMDAISNMRKIASKQCYISGMGGVVTDIKNLALKELPMYVVVAGGLSFVVLELTSEYFLIPVFFLLSIGMAILYNLGTNIFLGEVSYITKALTAVLRLGVTMDYSIFLLHSYEENKELYPDDRNEAMGHAISQTFVSIVGSSVTTIAGFAALCFMTFALGRDLGIVMAKGVVFGVICCVTVLPSMILLFDGPIEKSKHRPLMKGLERASGFILRHHRIWLAIFLILLIPAIYGNNNVQVYYDIAKGLPDNLESNIAQKKLEDDFNMNTTYMVMMNKNLDSKDKRDMINEIKDVKGVKYTLGIPTFLGPTVPESMIPQKIRSMLQGGRWEIAFVGSDYGNATHPVNNQIDKVIKIAKKYDPTSMVIGEAPLMKDLEDTTNVDIRNVNGASILAIFVIILLVFKSISLPVILVAVIEFAIAVNMAVPFYQGESLAFVASIVIGTIQLGATVDYAILMTTRYQTERKNGRTKREAIDIAHQTSIVSIVTSGLSFFAATFGVSMYTKVDMIGSICTLLARGSIISMIVVIFILPAMFNIFDKIICHTTRGFKNKIKREDGQTIYTSD